MNNHRDSMNNYDFNEAPPITDAHTLAYHALEHQNHPFNKCYTYFIVKEVSNPSELLATEQFFINKFNTKKPTGLNIYLIPLGSGLKGLDIDFVIFKLFVLQFSNILYSQLMRWYHRNSVHKNKD